MNNDANNTQATHPISTNILDNELNASDTTPIMNGNTAPPHTDIIMSPEISLDLSGILSTVAANITGNVLAIPNPINKTLISDNNKLGEITKPKNPAIEIITDIKRNFFGFMALNSIAPINREIINAPK